MRKLAHLADDEKPTTTLCGLPWELWQESVPSNEEIGFDDLDYGTKVLVREADEARKLKPGEAIHQCPACLKAAIRSATVSGASGER